MLWPGWRCRHENRMKAVSAIPPKVKSTLEDLLDAGKCFDSQAVEHLLTDVRMQYVYQYLKRRKFTKQPYADRDDQLLWFLSHAVSLSIPLKLRSKLFTLREIARAPKNKRAVMEWHPVAPGSREPALAIYLALLAGVSRKAFGSYLYRTVATVASVALNRRYGKDVTEKQVRSALLIFNPVKKLPKVRLYTFADPK